MPKKIIALRKATEKKVSVVFEDDETLLLPLDLVFEFQLRKEDIISDEVFEVLLTEAVKYKIQESALRFLSLRMHSSFELYQKLLKKKFEKHLIRQVLQTLEENRLLNDKNFAERFCVEAFYHKKIGRNKIRMLLKQRGVAAPFIEEGLKQLDQADESEDESPIELIAQKKLKQLRGRNLDEKKLSLKLTAFLVQRGYSFTEVRAVIKKILSSDEPIDE